MIIPLAFSWAHPGVAFPGLISGGPPVAGAGSDSRERTCTQDMCLHIGQRSGTPQAPDEGLECPWECLPLAILDEEWRRKSIFYTLFCTQGSLSTLLSLKCIHTHPLAHTHAHTLVIAWSSFLRPGTPSGLRLWWALVLTLLPHPTLAPSLGLCHFWSCNQNNKIFQKWEKKIQMLKSSCRYCNPDFKKAYLFPNPLSCKYVMVFLYLQLCLHVLQNYCTWTVSQQWCFSLSVFPYSPPS